MKKDQKTQSIRYLVIMLFLLWELTGCAEPQVQFVEQSQISSLTQDTAKEAWESVTDEVHQAETPVVYVHVCGAVQNAGVYALSGDARVFEAIEAAGGLTEEAAGERINQARLIADGEELYIPTKEEVLSISAGSFALPEAAKGADTADKVNINTADVATLTNLNGIGQSRAEAIIAWREENGRFSSIEEIKNIDGIADKTYEKLKDQITVN